MYLADTSVWVDYLRGEATPQIRTLKDLLSGEEIVGIAPIIGRIDGAWVAKVEPL